MNINNVSSEKLQKLNIYDNILDDPLYHKLINVGRNDLSYSSSRTYLGFAVSSPSLFSYIGCLIPEILFLFFWKIYRPSGSYNPSILIAVLTVLMLISLCISIFYAREEEGLNSASYYIDAAVTVLAYALIAFMNKSVYDTLLFCFLSHVATKQILYFNKMKEFKRRIKEKEQEYSEKNSVISKYQAEYEDFLNEANKRITICSEELTKRGIENDLKTRNYWWQNNFGNFCLGHKKNIFTAPHKIRYNISVSRSSYYSETMLYCEKNFSMYELNDEQKWLVLGDFAANSKKYGFAGTVSDEELDNEKLYAITCRWTKTEDETFVNIDTVSPTDEEIVKVNLQIDQNERMYNALKYNRAFTMDEMYSAYGENGADYNTRFISETIRSNKIETFVSNNTHESVSTEYSSDSENGMYILAYAIGDLLFFPPNTSSFKVEKGWNEISSTNWFYFHDEEIDGVLETFMSTNKQFENFFKESLFYGVANINSDDKNSKIMHSLARI